MTVIILKTARSDLREIWERLSDYGEKPPQKFRASFEKFVAQISDFPYMFSRYEGIPAYRRAVLVYDYLAFYQVDETRGTIKVYRVLHGKRNIVPLIEQSGLNH